LEFQSAPNEDLNEGSLNSNEGLMRAHHWGAAILPLDLPREPWNEKNPWEFMHF